MIPSIQIYFPLLFLSFSITIPEVISYAKVSKNGQEAVESQGEQLVGMSSSEGQKSEGRSVQDIVITASPVFVSARNPILQPGEAIDYPTTKGYSTLDQEMVSKLDSMRARQQAQERFHPPAAFEHSISHGNAIKQQNRPGLGFPSSSSSNSKPPIGTEITYARPVLSDTYDYQPPNFESEGSKPSYVSSDDYPPSDSGLKVPSSYGADSYLNDHGPNHNSHDTYGSKPMYGDDPPKAVEYETHFDHPPLPDAGYVPDHDYHHDVIYDHIPEDHLHYHDHTTTTEEPEMNDQRLSKRPYSYYYIGKKLWYIPLYFSIYFIIYIAALVLKSVARHKINFPANLAAAADARSAGDDQNQSSWWDYTVWILEAIEKYGKT